MAVSSSPTPHPRRRSGRDSADGQVLGVLLVVGGIGWFVQQAGLVSLSAGTMLSCLLIALGIGLVVTARRAGGGGLVVLGLVLTGVLASTSALDTGMLQRGAGERRFAPTTASQLEERYALGVGSLTLDLRALTRAELAEKRVRVQLGIGELVVLLPPASEVPVAIRGHAQAGDVNLLDRRGNDEHDDMDILETYSDPLEEGQLALDLDLGVGLGSIQVVRPGG